MLIINITNEISHQQNNEINLQTGKNNQQVRIALLAT